MRSNAFLSLVLCLGLMHAITPASAHDGHSHDGHDHDHSHAADASAAIMTTRPAAKSLPPVQADDVFHFVVYGDRTGGVPEGLKVLEQAVDDTNLLDPDLVMTVGDLIQGYNQTPEWLDQAAEYQEIMNRLNMRWYPVAGNHDVYWRGPDAPPQGHHESNYEKHFGPLWYSFQHKNAGFIVLYSDEGDPETNEKAFNQGRLQKMSDKQLEFLEKALKDHKDADHVFLFLHHPRWIGGGYTGGNWDVVHDMLKSAGNVTAVFAGHIHHMRFDGPIDGIAYYTLATTGGHLSAEIPGAGYLHHLNMVTVRPDDISVASLPIGSVMDPKEFTPEFLATVDQARSVRPSLQSGELRLNIDGSASGELTYAIKNTTTRPLQGSLVFGSPDRPSRDWTSDLDHQHYEIAAGQSRQFTFTVNRPAGSMQTLTMPTVRTELDLIGETTRIRLPAIDQPLPLRVSAVPADFFTASKDLALRVQTPQSAVRIPSDEFELPDGPFTIEGWCRLDEAAGYNAVIAKTQSSEYAIFMDEGAPVFDVNLNGRYVSAKSDQTIAIGQWTHIAGVFDGKEVRLYVNGKQVDSRPARGKRRANKLPLFLGADPDAGGNPTRNFVGLLDEVRLSTGAVYEADFTPESRFLPQDSTVLLMHLDRRVGPFVLDHSNSAAMGTLGKAADLVSHDR
ncbi:cyclic 3',5'-adenosine monophosphate phosphodiesterase [Crateriforma conspicua]|nr:LamG-like jellyroll fold domain-containing protein [Crateriforma conspicua]QDV61661.1 cyclic 3',5'-adenosine monophosphate phosphodiesterase [Crateriforma conspicua]